MARVLTLVVFFVIVGVAQVEADTIHMRFFESSDFVLEEDRFQLFSFSGLEAESVTLVIYGLEERLVPGVTLFAPDGSSLAEDLNEEEDSIAVVQAELPVNGMYTFLVSRQTDAEGLFRIMLIEGDPLQPDTTLLDTVDPFLPSRAFIVAGNSESPVDMRVSLVEDEETTELFVSRGGEFNIPDFDERTTPVTFNTWVNDEDQFYTLNVRGVPEAVRRFNASLSRFGQTLGATVYEIEVGAGTEEGDFVPRPLCIDNINALTNLFSGPSDNSETVGELPLGTEVEMTGVDDSGDWIQIVNPESPTGASWIRNEPDFDLSVPGCVRVDVVFVPTDAPDRPPHQSNDELFGLPPAGEPPSDAP